MNKARSKASGSISRDPVYNLTSVFTAHRDSKPAARLTLGDSGLSLEEADILVLLYGLSELGWDDCRIDQEKYVTFRDLKSLLVHDASLFARRIKKLSESGRGLVEVRKVKRTAGLHGNSMRVRISPLGIETVKPIWENFRKLAAKLFTMEGLNKFSHAELNIHRKINEEISRVLREWRDPVGKFF